MRISRPASVLSFTLIAASTILSAEMDPGPIAGTAIGPGIGALREIASPRGMVRIAFLTDPQGTPDGDTVASALPDQGRQDEGNALLEIYFLDKGTGRDLRFPFQQDELNRFIARNSSDPEAVTEAEMVNLIGDLADSLRIRMKGAEAGKGKP